MQSTGENAQKPSFIASVQVNPTLNRQSAGRFIDRKGLASLSQERQKA